MPEEHFKPKCQMVGEDGNVFAIIGRVSKALRNDGQPSRADQWREQCKSYDDVLILVHDYVEAY